MKKFEKVKYYSLYSNHNSKGTKIQNSEQTTEEEVIKKLSMRLRVQILLGLEAKRYKRLKKIIANAGDFRDNNNVGNIDDK